MQEDKWVSILYFILNYPNCTTVLKYVNNSFDNKHLSHYSIDVLCYHNNTQKSGGWFDSCWRKSFTIQV